jgi:hypothetical protein
MDVDEPHATIRLSVCLSVDTAFSTVRIGRHMPGLEEIGKALLVLGGVIILLGLVLIFAPRLPLLGRLPGDIVIQRGNFSCYFPIVTFLLLSLLLTIVINVLLRLLGK